MLNDIKNTELYKNHTKHHILKKQNNMSKKINFDRRITIRIDVKDYDFIIKDCGNISDFIRKSIKSTIKQKKSLKTP